MTERLLAELDDNGTVRRVIVCDSIKWAEAHLGGRWVETRYDDPTENCAGIGYGYDDKHPQRFAPEADALASVAPDALVFHKGRIARADTVPELAGKLELEPINERITR